jgi:hypothetical protein
MTAPAVSQARSLHEICEDVRRAECGACPALPGDECVFTTAPVSVPVTPGTRVRPARGYHVNRFAIAEADDLITIADMAAVLETAGSFTSTTVIYDDEQEAAVSGELGTPDDDDLESYCTECGSWIGMFFGLEGWRHFRGDPLPGGKRQLYDAGHEAVPAWCELPGRAISPADAETIRQALAEAAAARRERAAAWCVHCEGHPAGACERHVDDLDQADVYAELGRQLGQEADR